MTALPPYDGSPESQTAHYLHLVRLRATKPPEKEPTADALERHARRFGPEAVAETALEYGLEVQVEKPRPRPRRGGPTLRARVAGYLEAGHSVEVIAELENLTPARARRVVGEVVG